MVPNRNGFGGVQQRKRSDGLTHRPELIVDITLPRHNRPTNQAAQERWQTRVMRAMDKADNAMEREAPRQYARAVEIAPTMLDPLDQPDLRTVGSDALRRLVHRASTLEECYSKSDRGSLCRPPCLKPVASL